MQFTLTLKDRANIIATFKRAPAIASKEFTSSLERIAASISSDAYRNAPVNKDPNVKGGTLRQNIGYKRASSNGFVVYSNAKYSAYVDQGTKPHVILPRTKQVLAFQKDGKWIYAKRINHPGTKAQPFFSNAVKNGEIYANTEMQGAIGRVISQLI